MSEYLYTSPPLDRSVGLRRHIMTTAMHIFGGWSYSEIQVPMLHYFDALRPGLDEEQIERSFRFVDRGGNLMLLRPDVTPVIAQTYAYQMRTQPLPLRVSYTHKVVRLERSLRRNQLESYQIGVEHIGGDPFTADLELLLLALETMQTLGLPNYQISLADHQLANHLLHTCGAPSRMREQLRQAIIARDAHEVRTLMHRLGLRAEYTRAIMALVSLKGGTRQLDEIEAMFPEDRRLSGRVRWLRRLIEAIDALGHGDKIHIELAELGGAGYYTGVGFSIVSEGASRELGRGGRYDELIGAYGKNVSGAGFSLSLDAMVQALNPIYHAQLEPPAKPHTVTLDPLDPVEGLREALRRRSDDAPIRLSTRPPSPS